MKIGKLKFPDNSVQTAAGTVTPGLLTYANDADPFWADVVLSLPLDNSRELHGRSTSLNGNATFTATAPKYQSSSLLLDGTGDWLQVTYDTEFDLGASDFTIECWLYVNTSPTGGVYPGIVTQRGASTSFDIYMSGDNQTLNASCTTTGSSPTTVGNSTVLATGQWYHVAFVRFNNVLKLYVNGTATNAGAAFTGSVFKQAQDILVGKLLSAFDGHYVNGKISDVRITKRARYTANFTAPTTAFPTTLVSNSIIPMASQGDTLWDSVVLSMPLNSVVNLKNGASGVVTGNATISSAQSKFIGSSLYMDGSVSYIDVPCDDFIETTAWTIEFWVRPAAYDKRFLFFAAPNAQQGLHIYMDATGRIAMNNGMAAATPNEGTATLSLNQWYHLAVVRQGSTNKVYINGVLDYTQATQVYAAAGANLRIGRHFTTVGNDFQGYMNDIRVTKVARYTANFTPPVQAHPTAGYQPTTITIPGADGADGPTGPSGVSGFEQAFLLMGV